MATTVSGRTPMHLWIVGILAFLWSCFGCYDYLMTNLKNQTYLSQFTPDQIAYFDSLPSWLTAFWAIGVWGGFAGDGTFFGRSDYVKPMSLYQAQLAARRGTDAADDIGKTAVAVEIDDGTAVLAGKLRRFHDATSDARPFIGENRHPRLAELLMLQLGGEDGLVETGGAAEVGRRNLEPHHRIFLLAIVRHDGLSVSEMRILSRHTARLPNPS